MSIEDYKRQRNAMEVPSQGNLSPSRALLDTVVRLVREASLGGSYSHRVGEIGGYRNGYKPGGGLPNASGSLNLRASNDIRFVEFAGFQDIRFSGHIAMPGHNKTRPTK